MVVTRPLFRRAALLAGAILASSLAPDAAAQSSAPASALTLLVELAQGDPLDAEHLRGAIARELGGVIVRERGGTGGTLVVRVVRDSGPRAVVSFDGPEGRHSVRDISLIGDSTQEERDIALLAENVARDQTAQFRLLFPPLATAPAPLTPSLAPPSPAPGSRPYLVAGVDFAPWVGMSSVDRGRSTRSLSLGALGALSGGVEGLALSGGVDLARGPVFGAQISGVANVAERLVGVQVGGALNVSEGDTTGLQVGTVNITGARVRGVQIGVVNYAREADFQLGVVNVHKDGRFLVEAWTEAEMGLILAGVKHGGPHYHWIYGLGIRPADPSRPWWAVGVGAHVVPSEKTYVDLDMLLHIQLSFGAEETALLPEARAVVGYRFLPAVSAFLGPTFNVLAEGTRARGGAPAYSWSFASTSATLFSAWPGVALGVEAL